MKQAKTLGILVTLITLALPTLAQTDVPLSDGKLAPMSKPFTPKPLPQGGQPSSTLQRGGFSDGGGNAVGNTLFDFYENQGSKTITVKQLIDMEPLAKKVLKALDMEVPATDDGAIEKGFGTLLLESIAHKKIILDTKTIQSDACLNQSMVEAPDQVVVACQSDKEIRIYQPWFEETDSMNRAGLIIHELVLGGARKEMPATDKNLLEASVRELNRYIFTVQASDFAAAINEVFPKAHAIDKAGLASYKKVQLKRAQNGQYAAKFIDNYIKQNRLQDDEILLSMRRSFSTGEISYGECQWLANAYNDARQNLSKKAKATPNLDSRKMCLPE